MARLMIAAMAVATVLAVAHLPAGPIGPPCFANESAIELFTEVSLAGKVVVVTGSDSGIGLEVARALAARNGKIIMAGRNMTKMRAAMEDIKRTVPQANLFVTQPLNLASFASTRAFAESLKSLPAIHILVNNAGIASTPHPVTTGDHFDLVFQVDYASQWLLTYLLLPQLRAGKGRIVNVASKAAALACEMSETRHCLDLRNLPPAPTAGHVPVIGLPRSNYGIAKFAMIDWTEKLAGLEIAAGSGVTAFSVHPGYVNTSMASNVSKLFSWLACQSDGRQGAPCPTTPAMGALTPTFLALAPHIESDTGNYYEWCTKAALPNRVPMSQEYKNGLWKKTSEWVANFSKPFSTEGQSELLV